MKHFYRSLKQWTPAIGVLIIFMPLFVKQSGWGSQLGEPLKFIVTPIGVALVFIGIRSQSDPLSFWCSRLYLHLTISLCMMATSIISLITPCVAIIYGQSTLSSNIMALGSAFFFLASMYILYLRFKLEDRLIGM
jgi:hypothetical protein